MQPILSKAFHFLLPDWPLTAKQLIVDHIYSNLGVYANHFILFIRDF